jgi:SAM-dependent methyltransferase
VTDPTRRFSDRVEAYARHRPGYPPGVVEVLAREAGLRPGAALADVGSGTGILTEALLDAGYAVFAVEPNEAMRAAAEGRLGGRAGFVSVAGRAEATGLAARSVDAVVAAQAFHWFEPVAARAELARILRPGGAILLVWNVRRSDASALMRGYHDMIRRFAIDPVGLTRHDERATIAAFFGAGGFRELVFPHTDVLDRAALAGRASSASYLPGDGHARRAAMLAELDALFDTCAEEGFVRFEFDTHVYLGFVEERA